MNKYLSLLTIGILSLFLVSGSAQANHYLNHYSGQNTQKPTQAQIAQVTQVVDSRNCNNIEPKTHRARLKYIWEKNRP